MCKIKKIAWQNPWRRRNVTFFENFLEEDFQKYEGSPEHDGVICKHNTVLQCNVIMYIM
jgi:hypothetical protein